MVSLAEFFPGISAPLWQGSMNRYRHRVLSRILIEVNLLFSYYDTITL